MHTYERQIIFDLLFYLKYPYENIVAYFLTKSILPRECSAHTLRDWPFLFAILGHALRGEGPRATNPVS